MTGSPPDEPEISVAVPMHNEEGNVRPLYEEVSAVLRGLGRSYEILFVNDGSTDATLDRMLELVAQDPCFAAVELDGNFGEAAALSAGYATARGRIVVTMDGDLQNDPSDIPRLLERLEEGYKAVSGWRKARKEALLKRRLPSVVGNWLIARVSGVAVHDTGCGLKAYRREVVAGKNVPRGFQRFIPAVFGVRNHEVAEVRTEDRARVHGATHYGLSRTFEVLRDLAAIRFINRNPRLYARVLPAACAAGLAALIVGIVAPLPLWARLALAVVGGLVAVVAGVGAWGVHRFNLAQERKVYRIRRVHRQGGAGG